MDILVSIRSNREYGDQCPRLLWLLQHGAAIPPADCYPNDVERYVHVSSCLPW
jgi:hypothetical protein